MTIALIFTCFTKLLAASATEEDRTGYIGKPFGCSKCCPRFRQGSERACPRSSDQSRYSDS